MSEQAINIADISDIKKTSNSTDLSNAPNPANTTHSPSPTFTAFNLPVPIERALAALKYETPTPIQLQAIPAARSGQDILGCAQTGTGKTAAFLIPILANLLDNPKMTAIVISPTRELAVQINDVAHDLTRYAPEIKVALLIGGIPTYRQTQMLMRRPRIIVATPGKLADHLRRRNINPNFVGMVVMDETDRLHDIGFMPQINEIMNFFHRETQILMFSATLPPEIQKLVAQYLKNPIKITIGQISQPIKKIKQSVIQTTASAKNDALANEINHREGSVIIFVKTKSRADRVAHFLHESRHKVTLMHGDRTQSQRLAALDGFRNGRYRILVATDIAARGLDVPHIAHVINYDLPCVPEDYIHRIGRTARAGAEGNAVNLITPEDKLKWRDITRLLDPKSGGSSGKQQHNNNNQRKYHAQKRRNASGAGRGRPSQGGRARQQNAR